MTIDTTPLGDHVALVEPDSRNRFTIGRYISREPIKSWKLYRSEDGKTIVLQAVQA